MEAPRESYRTDYRKITIRTTDGSTLLGEINIGIKERVSDLFTKADNPFVVLSNVEHSSGSGRIFFINKDHIVWAEPEN